MDISTNIGTIHIDAEEAFDKKVQELMKGELKREVSQQLVDNTVGVLRDHVSSRYPGSQHWNPNKIYPEGEFAVVDIPGASRAYHDVDIKPKNATWLCSVVNDVFVKTKHVHQQQDPSLLPTVDDLAQKVLEKTK